MQLLTVKALLTMGGMKVTGTRKGIKGKTFREIDREYGIPPSTLRDWAKKGVFGDPASLPMKDRAWIFLPEHEERLVRFLKYRNWYVRRYRSEQPSIEEIVGLLDGVDSGNYGSVASTLSETRDVFRDCLDEIEAEIGFLEALERGETPEGPEDFYKD